jgi:thioredoxin reductase
MAFATGITIVGAGPFGLSVAAHLRARGLQFRIIGNPMQSWRNKMPKDMLLKSAGFSSSLSDPNQIFTLRDFCSAEGVPYRDVDHPIPLETFVSYGLAFQQRFVPDVEDERLVELTGCPGGFELKLESGTSFKSQKVVVAVGIDYFRRLPEPLAVLPRTFCTHSADHRDLDGFKGRDVAVIGGGSSASDLAILLHEAGANVQLIARQPSIHFGGPWAGGEKGRPLWKRIRAPISGIGPGWRSLIFTDAPWIYRYLPEDLRVRFAAKFLGPSGGWFMKERAKGVPFLLNHQIRGAEIAGDQVRLHLSAPEGLERSISVDHVIAATGYKVDVQRLPFLNPVISQQLALAGQSPRLSRHFESSVPGLYFIGAISATTFGPSMRFVAGARFTSRTLADHLTQSAGLATDTAPHEGVTELSV